MKNPIATITLNNGKNIILELRPDFAYNEVCSFINAAKNGYYNNFAIQRIVPGSWVDVSYTGFFRKECQYYLPNRIEKESNGDIKVPDFGDVCLGYYSDTEISGVEFFFPLRRADELTGKCPVFAQVIEGLDELKRLEKIDTYPNPSFQPYVEINVPKTPEVIVSVEVTTNDEIYPEPQKVFPSEHPSNWPKFLE